MAIVTVEQFNPKSQYWNKLYKVEESDFDPDLPIEINRYNGPYRYILNDMAYFLGMPRKLSG